MEEISGYPFPQSSIMSLTWVPHSPSSSSNSYRLLTPQINPYTEKSCNSSFAAADSTGMSIQASKRKNSRKISKPSYKHIPHKDKPPHLVARRNARERKRVQAVNSAFARLRKCVPIENRNKRLSKVKTLHRAIEYINGLQAMLRQSEDSNMLPANPMHYTRHRSESHTSQDDDEIDDERDMKDFLGDEYLESDTEVVNKENESQGWAALSSVSTYFLIMFYVFL